MTKETDIKNQISQTLADARIPLDFASIVKQLGANFDDPHVTRQIFKALMEMEGGPLIDFRIVNQAALYFLRATPLEDLGNEATANLLQLMDENSVAANSTFHLFDLHELYMTINPSATVEEVRAYAYALAAQGELIVIRDGNSIVFRVNKTD